MREALTGGIEVGAPAHRVEGDLTMTCGKTAVARRQEHPKRVSDA
jgi:hypothetical protein